MNRYTRISLALFASLMLAAAPSFAAKSIFNAHLTGKEEVPATESQATGQATFRVNSDLSAIDFQVNVGNIQNVTAVRIELAPAGATGPEVAVLYGPVAAGSGKSSGVLARGTLTASSLVGPMAGQTISNLVTAFETGQVYVNVTTDDGQSSSDRQPGDYSTGEIRGQIQ